MATLNLPDDGDASIRSPLRRNDKPRPYSRHGLNALKTKVQVAGLVALDRRMVAARALLDSRRDLGADLGGEAAVSAQQMALVEIATRTKLYVDHLDAFLMEQRSLVNTKRKAVLPALRERQSLADSLARILSQLGLERRQAPAKSLDQYLAERAEAKAAEQQESEAQHGPEAGS
jgi:hypothetical protein